MNSANQEKGFAQYLQKIGITDYPPPPEGVSLHSWIVSLYSQNHELIKLASKRKTEQAEAERKALLSEMPSTFELAKNLWHHLRQVHQHYKDTGRIYCDDAEVARRAAICNECPSGKAAVDKKGSLRCVICGCHIEEVAGIDGLGKAHYDALHCERGHW